MPLRADESGMGILPPAGAVDRSRRRSMIGCASASECDVKLVARIESVAAAAGRLRARQRRDCYFRLPETLVKVVDRLVPTTVMAEIMTTAMSAAIKPYSMAVAPDSSLAKDLRS